MLANVPRIITSWLPRRDAVGVEVRRGHAVLGEVLARRASRALIEPAGRDVVGGDAVAEHGQHPGAGDVGDRRAARAACRRSTAGLRT